METKLDVLISRLSAAAPESATPGTTAGPESKMGKPSLDPRPVAKSIKLDKWAKLVENVCDALKDSVVNGLSVLAQKIYAEVADQTEFDAKVSEQWEQLFTTGINQVLNMPETYGD